MQLSINEESCNAIIATVEDYYRRNGRSVVIFSMPKPVPGEGYEIAFLIDRKYVAKYFIGEDRGGHLEIVLLAIGPHYFPPADFWSYEQSTRFTLDASTEAVEKNLHLLDEFLVK